MSALCNPVNLEELRTANVSTNGKKRRPLVIPSHGMGIAAKGQRLPK
jgi:hypothetical protein